MINIDLYHAKRHVKVDLELTQEECADLSTYFMGESHGDHEVDRRYYYKELSRVLNDHAGSENNSQEFTVKGAFTILEAVKENKEKMPETHAKVASRIKEYAI